MNLEKYLKYMIYLPKENEKKFRIFIVEVSEAGGVLGDLVETIYPNAEVYWMNTPELF